MKYKASWTTKDGVRIIDQIYTADAIAKLIANLEKWGATDVIIKTLKEERPVRWTIRGVIAQQESGDYELDWIDFGSNPIDIEDLIQDAIAPYCTSSICGGWDAIVEEIRRGAEK